MSLNLYLDRGERIERMHFTALRTHTFFVHNVQGLQTVQERAPGLSKLLPPLSTLVDIVVVHMMRRPRPSISLSLLQAFKNQTVVMAWERGYMYVYDVCALVCMVCA